MTALDAAAIIGAFDSPHRKCNDEYPFQIIQEAISGTRRRCRPALEAPYMTVVVELSESVKFVGHLIDCPPQQVRIGMPVEVAFRKLSDEITLPCFKPVGVDCRTDPDRPRRKIHA